MNDDWKKIYRVFAESFILHCIDSLDGDLETRLKAACDEIGCPYESAAEFCETFGGEESITVAAVEWIRCEWPKRKEADRDATPESFAKEVATDIFIEHDF